jgi:hypothetical protein
MTTMAPYDNFEYMAPGRVQDRKSEGMEGMDEKLNGNYLMLIPTLCLEDTLLITLSIAIMNLPIN